MEVGHKELSFLRSGRNMELNLHHPCLNQHSSIWTSA